jgi:hypothetical protein
MTLAKTGCVLVVVLACLLGAAEEPPTAPPADFKLSLGLFGTEKTALVTGELVFRRGVAYQFLSDTREEVQIVDPTHARVVLLDLKRKRQTEITPAQLDAHLTRVRKAITTAIDTKTKTGGRSDRLAADMGRDLLDPKFEAIFDPTAAKLRLINPTVDVDTVGEPEPDPKRLALMKVVLTAFVKLGSFRDPWSLPPFTRIEALETFMTGHKLRPTEVSMVVRLSGPPKKVRWTYRLVSELTAREREAIARVDQLRALAKFVPYAVYDEDEE